jgi:Tfp pilus assembly protein FimV
VEVFEDVGGGSSGQSSSSGSGSGGSTSAGGGIAFGSSGTSVSGNGSSSAGASVSGSGNYYSGGSGGSVTTFENIGGGASGNLLTYQNGNVQGSSQDGVLDIYTVKKGDTLWEIARSYYGDPTLWFKIQEANPGKVPNVRTMRIGIQLIIPNLGVQGNNGQAQTFDRSSNSSSTVLVTETVSPRGTYTVKQGDSLWSIAQKTYGSGSKWRKILSANPRSLAVSGDVKTLKVGFVLNLPDVSAQAATEQNTQTNNIQTFERATEQTNNVSNITTEASSNVQTAASTTNQTQNAQPIYRDSVSNIGNDRSAQDGEVETTE